jgi:hypothetical protein
LEQEANFTGGVVRFTTGIHIMPGELNHFVLPTGTWWGVLERTDPGRVQHPEIRDAITDAKVLAGDHLRIRSKRPRIQLAGLIAR